MVRTFCRSNMLQNVRVLSLEWKMIENDRKGRKWAVKRETFSLFLSELSLSLSVAKSGVVKMQFAYVSHFIKTDIS